MTIGTSGAAGQQFPVHDRRTPAEMAQWLHGEGFAVAWDVP